MYIKCILYFIAFPKMYQRMVSVRFVCSYGTSIHTRPLSLFGAVNRSAFCIVRAKFVAHSHFVLGAPYSTSLNLQHAASAYVSALKQNISSAPFCLFWVKCKASFVFAHGDESITICLHVANKYIINDRLCIIFCVMCVCVFVLGWLLYVPSRLSHN